MAEWFNTFGVAGFVLRYRLAPAYRFPAPMLDVQRAIRTVRAKADEWKIDPHRVGVMGFSAGGHLASTAATHFDAGRPDAADPIDRQSCRPDFAILAYPVITMTGKFGHSGSKKNLLGDNPDPQLAENLSNEKQVTPADASDVSVPYFRRHGRPGRKQRPLLSGAAQSGRAGRNAHLREGAPRNRHGDAGSETGVRAGHLAGPAARLDAAPRARGESLADARQLATSRIASKTECARKRLFGSSGHITSRSFGRGQLFPFADVRRQRCRLSPAGRRDLGTAGWTGRDFIPARTSRTFN